MEKYDLIIIGGSAAATAAGIYAVRRNLNFKIISKDFGGEVATSGEIDNYPGVPDLWPSILRKSRKLEAEDWKSKAGGRKLW